MTLNYKEIREVLTLREKDPEAEDEDLDDSEESDKDISEEEEE